MAKIGIFISGTGSNMDAVIRNYRNGYFSRVSEISFVLSDKRAAPGLEKAAAAGIPTLVVPKKKGESVSDFEARLIEAISPYNVELIVLAGFMRIISPYFLAHFKGRIINIHPSLLPAFKGVAAQEQAFEYGVKISGCSVHFVDESLDGGPIIIQKAVDRHNDDTLETFKKRILAEEHRLLSEAIEIVTTGSYHLKERYTRVERRHET